MEKISGIFKTGTEILAEITENGRMLTKFQSYVSAKGNLANNSAFPFCLISICRNTVPINGITAHAVTLLCQNIQTDIPSACYRILKLSLPDNIYYCNLIWRTIVSLSAALLPNRLHRFQIVIESVHHPGNPLCPPGVRLCVKPGPCISFLYRWGHRLKICIGRFMPFQ